LPRLGPFAALGVSAHRNDTASFVIARHAPPLSLRGTLVPKQSPDLKGNPKQIPISKFKGQNRLGHWDFGHLILFSISDLVFRIYTLLSLRGTPPPLSLRGTPPLVIARHNPLPCHCEAQPPPLSLRGALATKQSRGDRRDGFLIKLKKPKKK